MSGNIGSQWADPVQRERLLASKSAARARIASGEGFLYAAEVIGTEAVKIGFSLNPRRRMQTLPVQLGRKVRLLAFAPASQVVERQLHRDLAAHQIPPRADWHHSEVYPRSILSHPAIPTSLAAAIRSKRSRRAA